MSFRWWNNWMHGECLRNHVAHCAQLEKELEHAKALNLKLLELSANKPSPIVEEPKKKEPVKPKISMRSHMRNLESGADAE